MPTPNFKMTVIEDCETKVTIYVGAVKIQSKEDSSKRMHFRIVEKPAAAAPGMLFTFKKLTIHVQAETFANLVNVPEVQAWFFDCCKNVLLAKFASENGFTEIRIE